MQNPNLEFREQLFKEEIETFQDFDATLRISFFNYWSEANRGRTKMRWEMEKTWDIKKRLNRFLNNQNKWYAGTNKTGTSAARIERLKDL